MKRNSRGFTIVEVLVVVITISILTAMVFNYNRAVRVDSRDEERRNDVMIIQEALEKYYTRHGEYPRWADLSSNALTTLDMSSGQQAALITPTAPEGTHSSLVNVATPDIHQYGYTTANGTCASAGCTKYRLYYRLEATSAIVTVQSRY